ncbi:MAG TPA: MBL fold metallo-hydrolase [bacterium]|nr:MBL fold metallo-hydrolase [bacterium]HPQ66687.1 MBL fold metallo-hydrolase [bacterium]
MIRICVLSSGSTGNATLVRTETTAVLVDAGLSASALSRLLDEQGLGPERLDAILIGHEHTDHVRGLKAFSRTWRGPVYVNAEIRDFILERVPSLPAVRTFEKHDTWSIGDIDVSPFPVEHDAIDPVGFVLEHGGARVAVATDLGFVTGPVREAFRGAHAAVIEANYDHEMLMSGRRPWSLKQRIKGTRGHLANEDTAEFIAEVCAETLVDVFLAHISRDCNRPDIALGAVKDRLRRGGKEHIRIHLTYPDRPSPEVSVGAPPPAAPGAGRQLELDWPEPSRLP